MTKIESQLWDDCKALYDKYRDIQNTAEAWTECVQEACALCVKYADKDMAKQLIITTINMLEGIVKSREQVVRTD